MSTTPSACSAPAPPAGRFCVVVPVKRADIAKSRLAPLGDEVRRALVAAFTQDTVAAALATPEVAAVLVVTDDHVLAAAVTALGAHAVPDPVTDDLNGSLVQAAVEVDRRVAGVHGPLLPVALCADLPALRPTDLSAALREASGRGPCFVPDADGTGTTAYLAPTLDDFAPRFGPGSRAAHVASGAEELVLDEVPSLRRDVDTPADLVAAMALGLGAHSAGVVAGLPDLEALR